MLELAIRLVFSLAVVLGLLALLTKFGSRRFRGRRDAMVQVVHRQHLSRGTAVSVVTVGSRVLVLGTTEHQVRVLAELDPEDVAEHLPEVLDLEVSDELPATIEDDVLTVPDSPSKRPHLTPVRSPEGPLTGSVLSADTWRQAFAAATGKAS